MPQHRPAKRRRKIEWSEKFSVGVDEIDAQHRQLLELMNKLGDTADAEGSTKSGSFSALNAMVNYAELHFTTEESYLQRYSYPEYLTQKKEHEEFVEKVFSMMEQLEDEGVLTLGSIILFLHDWYVDHIIGEDQKYKDFILGKKRVVLE